MRYVIHFGPETLHIDMEGVLTFMDSRAFYRMISAMSTEHARGDIKLNVRLLKNMDCTGLRLMMKAHDIAKQSRRTLTFVEPSGQVLDSLKAAACHNYLNIAA